MKRIICRNINVAPYYHVDNVISGITMKSGYSVTPVKIAKASLTEEIKETDAGDVAEQTMNVSLQRNTANADIFNEPLVVKFTDADNNEYIWGDTKNPVRKRRIEKDGEGITVELKRKTVSSDF